jgi:hypothetical protein
MTPLLAMRRGPVGPSGVKTMFRPLRAPRISSRSALPPPFELEPRTHSTPASRKTPALMSPSFEREEITMIGFRKRECSISSRCSCQNDMMYCF